MSLKEQLDQTKAAFISNIPAEVQTEIFQCIKDQQQSGIIVGLNAGDKAPNFSLMNSLGKQVTLYDELAKSPVILIFYRGSWCPFCNVQLRAYQQVLSEIQNDGAQLIAVTPQRPDKSLSQKEKENLAFQVLSDLNGYVAERYQILFELPGYLQNTFQNKLGLNLTAFNKSDRWVLPVPATYLIDKEGLIRYAHVDPDFMKRLEPQVIIEQLKKL
ncbi:peroxiredoxin-like family protein [Paenibacillus aceris]|uniref:thioredoxin-dependent peroxiredoxin n=1 Tax=Paenibacillus aceris TaxID=869555 RepID=A0ABS4I092_9BACL|nr:peroxiredoxin-like family protein [Paenibacillus aceris]MBP1964337.1 peroxiredoxin [Paenibacillus aceris]NHW36656.1 AhpC/TSA family protein [Paenibacillus aceris]